MQIEGGSTDVTTYFKMRLTSNNQAATGLTATDFDLQYVRSGAAPSAKVDATAGTAGGAGAHSDNTVVEPDATDQPGLYRIDWPDAAFAAGVREVILTVKVATAYTEDLRVEINPVANVVQISGDTTAADNLEAMFDGTGYLDDTAPSSRAQISSLSVGSGGISTTANSDTTITTGTPTLTYTSTQQLDGVYHEIAPSGSVIDMYYEFQIGGTGVPQSVEWDGYVQTNNDNLEAYFYNWGGASFEQVGTIAGTSGTTDQSLQFIATTAHVGTGADLGKVRFRLASSGADVVTNLATDRVLCTYAVVQSALGFLGGAVWYDDNNGEAGTSEGIGSVNRPSSVIADARTIADANNLQMIHCLPGSTVTLGQTFDNFEFIGHNWTFALGGQQVTNTFVQGATVSGTFSGAGLILEDCIINAITGPGCTMRRCFFNEVTITNNGTNIWAFNDCRSRVAGTGSPNFDFGAAAGSSNVALRNYMGGIEIENIGAAGTDVMSMDGMGQLILNANCAGGTIALRGIFSLTDNASGLVNLVRQDPTANQIQQGTAQGGTANTITLSSSASATNGAYDPGTVQIITGPGAGETRGILGYNGTSKVAVVDKDWRTTPTTASSYVVYSASSPGHVNEGLAQGGTSTTITLNTAASSTDDIYIGQTVFLVGSTGQDQARIVTDYNGTTKVATVNKAWQTNPDSTTSYVMIPLPGNGDSTESIKTKTDQLTFTKSNELDSNIQSVNDVTVTGNGQSGTEWGP